MKKKILFLLILILLTGCKADYNLKINLGGNVIESGSIYIDAALLGKGDNSSDYKVFLDELLEKYGASAYRTKFKFKQTNYVGVRFNHRYTSISGYTNQTPAIPLLYNFVSDQNEEGHVKINSASKSKIGEYHNLIGDIPTRVEGIEVSITLPYKVTKHNAARVDSLNNEYIWILTPGMANDQIVLEYNENQLYSNNPLDLLRFVDIYIYIMIALVLIIAIGIAMIKSKITYMNRL